MVNQDIKNKDKKVIYKDEFDKIWVDIILPLLSKYIDDYGLKCKSQRYIESRIWHNYNNLRDLFIKKYMRYNVANIDRHKIAACILKSILKVKPFYIPLLSKLKILLYNKDLKEIFNPKKEKDNVNNYIYYANEYLALSVALSIINGYIKADSDKPLIHKMILPDPFSDKDPNYLLDVCIDLHFSGLKRINVATFSNVFFLWEKYSCRRKQCDNLEEECKRLLIKSGECVNNDKELEQQIKNIRLGVNTFDNTDDNNITTTSKEQ